MWNGIRTEKFSCCRWGVAMAIVLCPLQERLFEVEAFAEGGSVEVEDGYEFIAEAFLWCVASDAEFEVCTGLVKVTD